LSPALRPLQWRCAACGGPPDAGDQDNPQADERHDPGHPLAPLDGLARLPECGRPPPGVRLLVRDGKLEGGHAVRGVVQLPAPRHREAQEQDHDEQPADDRLTPSLRP
jgi:hypothetical protein